MNNKIKIAYVFTSCKRSGPIEVMYNLLSNINQEKFETYLITLYDEIENRSALDRFIPIVTKHYFCPLNKIRIMLGQTAPLKKILNEIQPDLVHSLGVFPDHCISEICRKKQVITLHSFMSDDFSKNFGSLVGRIMEKIQLRAVKRAKKVWACSESLGQLYRNHKNLRLTAVTNGIDTKKYTPAENVQKKETLREKLGLPKDGYLFISAGKFYDLKDQQLILKAFSTLPKQEMVALALLGDGVNLEPLKNQYAESKNIIFTGNVNNVNEFLQAADAYVSASHSEGMPMGVLEAMASGLPVILSDIIQHKEILNGHPQMGGLFPVSNAEKCAEQMMEVMHENNADLSANSLNTVRTYFDARVMAEKYQNEYLKILEK